MIKLADWLLQICQNSRNVSKTKIRGLKFSERLAKIFGLGDLRTNFMIWTDIYFYMYFIDVPQTLVQMVLFWRRLRGSSNKSDPEIP